MIFLKYPSITKLVKANATAVQLSLVVLIWYLARTPSSLVSWGQMPSYVTIVGAQGLTIFVALVHLGLSTKPNKHEKDILGATSTFSQQKYRGCQRAESMEYTYYSFYTWHQKVFANLKNFFQDEA